METPLTVVVKAFMELTHGMEDEQRLTPSLPPLPAALLYIILVICTISRVMVLFDLRYAATNASECRLLIELDSTSKRVLIHWDT
jgi:hypothetical protein